MEENLSLLRDMRAGRFGDGEKVLRAKIDMAHPNMLMRDPVMYRIRHTAHFRHVSAEALPGDTKPHVRGHLLSPNLRQPAKLGSE